MTIANLSTALTSGPSSLIPRPFLSLTPGFLNQGMEAWLNTHPFLCASLPGSITSPNWAEMISSSTFDLVRPLPWYDQGTGWTVTSPPSITRRLRSQPSSNPIPSNTSVSAASASTTRASPCQMTVTA